MTNLSVIYGGAGCGCCFSIYRWQVLGLPEQKWPSASTFPAHPATFMGEARAGSTGQTWAYMQEQGRPLRSTLQALSPPQLNLTSWICQPKGGCVGRPWQQSASLFIWSPGGMIMTLTMSVMAGVYQVHHTMSNQMNNWFGCTSSKRICQAVILWFNVCNRRWMIFLATLTIKLRVPFPNKGKDRHKVSTVLKMLLL